MDLKNLLLAFVRNHKESRIQNDDVIAGKGRPIQKLTLPAAAIFSDVRCSQDKDLLYF